MNYFIKFYKHVKIYGFHSLKVYSLYKVKVFLKKPVIFIRTWLRIYSIKKKDKNLGSITTVLHKKNIQFLEDKFKTSNKVQPDGNKNEYSLEKYGELRSNENLRLLVLLPYFIGNRQNNVENELTINVINSALHAGWIVQQFYGDSKIHSKRTNNNLEFRNLVDLIENFKPHLLCIDSNAPINFNEFSREKLLKLKQLYKFKVLMFVPDFELKKLRYWATDLVDYLNYSRPSMRNKIKFISDHKLICLPGIPYCEALFEQQDKKHDFYFSGSKTRQREIYFDALKNTKLKINSNFGNRIFSNSPDYFHYRKNMCNSQMTFSNGYISKHNSLISGRFIEAILSKCVCFYEICPDLDVFFKPLRHYIPVSNIHEFAITAQFLNMHPELLYTISQNAYDYYMKHYSSKLFWNYITIQVTN